MERKCEISQRLRQLRMEREYSPKDFAAYLNIKLQSYYCYERGAALPSVDGLIGIAEKCNVSLDWLCGITSVQNSTAQKHDVIAVLEDLLIASRNGQKIEVQVNFPQISSYRQETEAL